jgi:hypothetical protein
MAAALAAAGGDPEMGEHARVKRRDAVSSGDRQRRAARAGTFGFPLTFVFEFVLHASHFVSVAVMALALVLSSGRRW